MESQLPAWFENSGTDGVPNQVLPSPKQVLKDHLVFKQKLRNAIKIGSKNVAIASTEKELKTQIEGVKTGLSPAQIALQNLQDASKSHDTYVENRESGSRRVGRWAQEFATGFGEFVSAYSGIVDVVKGAGGPYGEVAYQTLSILLIVVVNKSNNDTKIKNLLEDMRKSFPRLENWSDIYPTDEMRVLVATAYEQVIEFSRAAAAYFASFWKRFVIAIIAPPSIGIDKVATIIHKTLAEINSEAMYGLHGRSQNIESEVVRSGKTIDQLKAQVISSNERLLMLQVDAERKNDTNDLLRLSIKEHVAKFEAYKREVEQRVQQEDQQRLEALEVDLGVTCTSEETNVENTKTYLMKVFPNTTRYSQHLPEANYSQMSRKLLQKTEYYQNWISSPKSSMLFFSGRTVREGRHFPGWSHSWLSPAAIYTAEDFASEAGCVAFFSCHPGMESRSIALKQVISSIVLQILSRNSHILREKAVQFHSAAMSGPFQINFNGKTHARAIVKLLADVLAEIRDRTTYIVLDRLDKCEGRFAVVMDEFVRLIGNPACNVKLLVIAETSFGGGEWHPEFLPEDEYNLECCFRRQDWHQSRLTTLELNKGERPITWISEGSNLTLVNE